MFRSIRLTQIAAMLAALGSLAVAPQASAGSILGAVGASINSGGPGFGSINDTFNQAGLRTTYISGVTDFDSYIASQPSHSYDFWGNEWYGIPSGASASVTYDLGAVHTVNAFALWNEDIFGLGRFNLLYSGDGKQFTALLTNVTPHVNPDEVDYGPESFAFGAVSARYFRVEAPNCPASPGSIGSHTRNDAELAKAARVSRNSSWRVSEAVECIGRGAKTKAMSPLPVEILR